MAVAKDIAYMYGSLRDHVTSSAFLTQCIDFASTFLQYLLTLLSSCHSEHLIMSQRLTTRSITICTTQNAYLFTSFSGIHLLER